MGRGALPIIRNSTRGHFGAPRGGSVARSMREHSKLFGLLAPGLAPLRQGDQRTGRRGNLLGKVDFGMVMGSIRGLNRGDREPTPEQQAQLDWFYNRDLSHLDPNTAQGQEQLRSAGFTEWLLARAGWGPEGVDVRQYQLEGYSNEAQNPPSISGDVGQASRGRSIEDNAEQYIEDFGLRGPASAILAKSVGDNIYRQHDSAPYVGTGGISYRIPETNTPQGTRGGRGPATRGWDYRPAGDNSGDPRQLDWPGFTGDDMLLDASNIFHRDRQEFYGTDPYSEDFAAGTEGPGAKIVYTQTLNQQYANVQPIDYEGVSAGARDRSKRRATGAAARGRKSASSLARGAGSRGLLLDQPTQTLGGGPSSTGAGI